MGRQNKIKFISSFIFSTTIFYTFIASLTLAGSGKSSYNFKPATSAMLSITTRETSYHVSELASVKYQGREAGTHGQWLAAQYIGNEFSEYGLKSLKGGDYFQPFEIVRTDLKSWGFWLERESKQGKETVELTLKYDFIPFKFTGEGEISAPIAFVGYGITAPEYGYDDYADIDVRGKIVLVLRHEPQEYARQSVFDGIVLTRHSLFEVKARNARAHGAIGMLLVTDPQGGHGSGMPQGFWPAFYPERKLKSAWQVYDESLFDHFISVWISTQLAQRILNEAGQSLIQLQKEIDKNLTPHSFTIPDFKAHIKLQLEKEFRTTQNVIGFLQGSDPKLSKEVVVVGAHYDHIGIKHGHIYPGADDNASGTAALLEIAEAFSDMPIRPRRSILFIAFTAEELGLLGSEYYVNHPWVPLSRTVAMINLDMIGRNEENQVTVIGSNRSPELQAINEAANREIGLTLLYNGEKYFSRSDQANFARNGIPVIFYNTDTHEDYHQPTDTPEKINAIKMTRIARLAFLVAWEVANIEVPPTMKKDYIFVN